jgi:hypothetical protein
MTYIKYIHDKREVWVKLENVTLHDDFCICHECEGYSPGHDTHCPIAQEVSELNKKYGLVTPVWECPDFVEIRQ